MRQGPRVVQVWAEEEGGGHRLGGGPARGEDPWMERLQGPCGPGLGEPCFRARVQMGAELWGRWGSAVGGQRGGRADCCRASGWGRGLLGEWWALLGLFRGHCRGWIVGTGLGAGGAGEGGQVPMRVLVCALVCHYVRVSPRACVLLVSLSCPGKLSRLAAPEHLWRRRRGAGASLLPLPTPLFIF